MAYKIPYTFIPGTKAKANEVNSNFSKVADYFTELNADLITTTSNLETVETDLAETKKLIQECKTKFCVNSSEGTLIATTGTSLYFNSSFVITNFKGVTATITTLPSINCQSLSNGSYNIFVSLDGMSEYFANKIYKQKTEPATKNVNDIWLNTSIEPFFAGKWDGAIWKEYLKVPIGNVEIENNAIKTTTIFPFNQNGYNINQLSSAVTELSALNATGKTTITNLCMPDYANGVSKANYTIHQAESDGWLMYKSTTSVNNPGKLEFGTTTSLGLIVYVGSVIGQIGAPPIPINKGMYYKCSDGTFQSLTFYPSKGTL